MCARSQLTVRHKVGGASAHMVIDAAGTHGAPTANAEQMANEIERRPIMGGQGARNSCCLLAPGILDCFLAKGKKGRVQASRALHSKVHVLEFMRFKYC